MYTTQEGIEENAKGIIWFWDDDVLTTGTIHNLPSCVGIFMETYDRDVAQDETTHLCGEAGGFELPKTEPHEPPFHCRNDKHGCDAELCNCSCGMCADFPDDLTDDQAATLADNERMGISESIETEIKEQISDEWRIIQRERMNARGEQ